MKRLLAAVVVAMVLGSGCTNSTPRYQIQVVGEKGYVVVYRLDTATGEIETFLASSPQFVEERLGRQTASMLRGFFDSMTFTPGAKLAPKATR